MAVLVLLSILGLITLFFGFSADKKLPVWLGIVGLVVVLVFNFMGWNLDYNIYDMLLVDNYSIAFTGVIGFGTIFILLLLSGFPEKAEVPLAEMATLLIFTLFGAYLMLSYSNLVMLFIGIEILSISLYILAGSKKSSLASNEAAMKYFLMGSFATGFLLFGITLLYGVTGSFDLGTIKTFVSDNAANTSTLLLVGIILMLIGLAFKISAAPFHFWAPDVYQGSPSIITVFMATVVKTAGIAAFFKLFYTCFIPVADSWRTTIWVLAALTMAIGNITAVYQTSVKRMLAYSSIAHAGYLLIALLALNNLSSTAVLYYAIAYSLATIASFAVLIIVQQAKQNDNIDSFKGLAKNNPFLAVMTSIALCSLAGIPPLAGFFAKFYLFSAAIQEHFYWIVIIAVLNSCVGIYYYFRVIVNMFSPSAEQETIAVNSLYKAVILVCVILSFVLGLLPDLILQSKL